MTDEELKSLEDDKKVSYCYIRKGVRTTGLILVGTQMTYPARVFIKKSQAIREATSCWELNLILLILMSTMQCLRWKLESRLILGF